MMDAIGRVHNPCMADFDIPTAMAAFFSQGISVVSRWLFMGHEIAYHV